MRKIGYGARVLAAVVLSCMLAACGSSAVSSAVSSVSAPAETSTAAPTATPDTTYAAIDYFVGAFNGVSDTPISDLKKIDIQDKEYYQTEFRLAAFKDAPAELGSIGNSTIMLINYGQVGRTGFRVYITADSADSLQKIMEGSAAIMDAGITAADFDSIKTADGGYSSSFVLGGLVGTYSKSDTGMSMMLDSNNTDFWTK